MEIYAMGFITDKDIASTTQKELKLLEICNYMIKLFPVQVQIKQKKKETEQLNPNSALKGHGYFLGQVYSAARKRINDKFTRRAEAKVTKMVKLHLAGDIAGKDKIEKKANLEWSQWSEFGFKPQSIMDKFESALQKSQAPDNHVENPDVKDQTNIFAGHCQ